jgi:hypothetical protein
VDLLLDSLHALVKVRAGHMRHDMHLVVMVSTRH